MKTINIMRGYTGLQAFFPSVSGNVQEAAPRTQVSIAASNDKNESYRPRLLSQRNARNARRLSH
ncbi:MAG: hypothetical protein AAFP81_13160 [Pseudomonadota bacterium]